MEGDIFSREEIEKIRLAVKEKYSEVSVTAEGRFRYSTGRQGAERLGYDRQLLNRLSEAQLLSFCGVGNPFRIAPIAAGSAVLDIGCGAGFDLLVAAETVGANGRVCGIDLSAEMLERARQNVSRSGFANIETLRVESEEIPYAEKTFDTVISNGVINLSPRKLALFREIRRVLKPRGRLQFADIVLERDLPLAMAGDYNNWSQ